MTTVQLSITFQRPALGEDLLVAATLHKIGRSLAFADVVLTPKGASDPARERDNPSHAPDHTSLRPRSEANRHPKQIH